MQHPFVVLRPEYEQLLGVMRVQRPTAVQAAADLVLRPDNLRRYIEVGQATGVPAALIGALDYRESACNAQRALGQGDRWDRVSTHVPVGKGPFGSWKDAAIFYVGYGHLNVLSVDRWNWAYACWKGEVWNGFGPRNHGRHTGYLWAGTNVYDGGKYVADGVWDPEAKDAQIGIVPLMRRVIALEPSLKFDDTPVVDHVATPVALTPTPLGVGVSEHDTKWLQEALNKAYLPPNAQLLVDGSYGRRTREAVRSFQRFNKLEADGLYGPKTNAALIAALQGVR